ncbi:MAG: hypothetical protein IJF88_01285 [Oscillospiraceae bacterium]|nr:hypothetical protein [Oscillospiraceae bacterium]
MDTMDQEDGGAARMSESELLKGLIEAGTGKDSKDSYERIQIRRKGKLFFEFRIRPISEEESVECREKATKFAPRKRGQPKREIETNAAKFRSWLIYTATVDEDRAKTWDSKEAQDALNVLTGVDMIEAVLLAGEKDQVIDRINEISGYGEEALETAKNS